jgi:hypothetical protein
LSRNFYWLPFTPPPLVTFFSHSEFEVEINTTPLQLETSTAALELKTDVASLELETDVAGLELEMNGAALELETTLDLETEIDVPQGLSK